MATLRDIKRRIQSVKKTAQITKAMQMVAAAKLRRIQEALESTRPYAEKMDQVMSELVSQSDLDAHPFLEQRPGPRKLELLIVSTDRGLCGGLNTNLFRQTLAFVREHRSEYAEIQLNLVGRKAREYFKRREIKVRGSRAQVLPGRPGFELVKPLARDLVRSFVSGDADEVGVLFTRFQTMMTQKPAYISLLPLQRKDAGENREKQLPGDFIYEPSRDQLLASLLPRHIEVRLYWAMLESLTSEFAARMTAMDSATANAKDMIDRLTLTYNRARQAAITKELMDIVSGAEGLR
jgi:F-type H+-transporting ATPase subunit gamma